MPTVCQAANKFGAALRDAAGGASVPRLALPDAAASTLQDLDLKVAPLTASSSGSSGPQGGPAYS